MNLEAIIFMLSAWGFTLGLLTYCVILLIKNPPAESFSSDSSENDDQNPGK